jgi:ketosteroid isomerase-like protein
MRTVIRSLGLCLGACMLVAAGPAGELPSVDDPVPTDEGAAAIRASMERTHRRFRDAYNRQDAQALARLYAEDAILVGPEGRQARGRVEIEAYWEEVFRQSTARLAARVVEIGGSGDVGWEYGTFSIEPAPSPGVAQPEGRGEALQTTEGHYVVIAAIDGDQALIRLHVGHPGEQPLAGERQRPTPPGAGPSRAPGERP